MADFGVWATVRGARDDADSQQGTEDEDEEPLVGKPGQRDGGKLTNGAVVTIVYTEHDTMDGSLKERLEDLGAEVTVRQIRADSPDELTVEARRLVNGARGNNDEDVDSQEG